MPFSEDLTYIINNFLILWCIYQISSLADFKNCAEYLTSDIAQIFISFLKISAAELGFWEVF